MESIIDPQQDRLFMPPLSAADGRRSRPGSTETAQSPQESDARSGAVSFGVPVSIRQVVQ
jgi:hypothetical protein